MQAYACMSRLATVGAMNGVAPPVDDADVPRYWRELGLPRPIDVHVHFLPDRVQAKVWRVFAPGARQYRRPWPVHHEPPGGGRPPNPARPRVPAVPTPPH